MLDFSPVRPMQEIRNPAWGKGFAFFLVTILAKAMADPPVPSIWGLNLGFSPSSSGESAHLFIYHLLT